MLKPSSLLLLVAVVALGQPRFSDITMSWAASFKSSSPTPMAVDNDGNSYLMGSLTGPFAPPNPPYGPPSSAYLNIVVIKLDSNGIPVWSTVFYGGTSRALAVDPLGNVYLTGYVDGNAFPTTPGAFQTRLSTPKAAFAAKLNSGGLLEWSTLLGGDNRTSSGLAIAADATGVYVAGQAEGHEFPTTRGAFQEAPGLQSDGSVDGFIAKLNPAGSALLFSTLLSGTNGSYLVDRIAIESSGAVYALGEAATFGLTIFPLTPGAYQSSGCLFLTKLNSTGSALIFSTFLTAECTSSGLSVDAGGNSYVVVGTGYASLNTRVLKVNSAGTRLVYSSTLQGNNGLTFEDVVVDSSGNAFVAGTTASSDFPIQSSCFPSIAGVPVAGTDFVVRLDPQGKLADGGYFPIAPASRSYATLLKMDAIGNVYTLNTEAGMIVVRKFAPGTLAAAPVHLWCVANSGTLFKSTIAPGEIVSLFGDGIGPDQAANLDLDASGKVTKAIANTQVLFDGIPAPLLYAQKRQINAVVPWEIQGRKTTEICVVYLGSKTNCIQAPVSEMSPGFFRVRPFYIAALNQDGTVNSPSNPATQGSIVTLYVTGTGPSAQPATDGEVTQGIRSGSLPVSMILLFVGGGIAFFITETPTEVLFHGPAPALVSGAEVIQVAASPLNYVLRMRSSTGELFQDSGYINYR